MTNTWLWIGAGFALFYLLDANKASAQNSSGTLPDPEVKLPSAPPSTPVDSKGFPLQVGSRGANVVRLQQAIMNSGNTSAAYVVKNSGGTDGIFGEGTLHALRILNLPDQVDYQTFTLLTQQTGV